MLVWIFGSSGLRSGRSGARSLCFTFFFIAARTIHQMLWQSRWLKKIGWRSWWTLMLPPPTSGWMSTPRSHWSQYDVVGYCWFALCAVRLLRLRAAATLCRHASRCQGVPSTSFWTVGGWAGSPAVSSCSKQPLFDLEQYLLYATQSCYSYAYVDASNLLPLGEPEVDLSQMAL